MKIDATDPNWPMWRKFLFPCDCGSAEYLHISWWDDGINDNDESIMEGYLEVVPAIWAPNWRDRLKAIAKIIAGRPFYHGGIILNPETVVQLRETLGQLELDQKRERQVNKDGKIEYTNEDKHIHQDADT